MNPNIIQLQMKVDALEKKFDSLSNSSAIDRNIELAFRERLNPPKIIVDTIAPFAAPNHIGDIFINYFLNKVYISQGTSSSSDWLILN